MSADAVPMADIQPATRGLRSDEASERAKAEAEARRTSRDPTAAARPPEIAGRGGLEPVRYGDWEVGGLATDF